MEASPTSLMKDNATGEARGLNVRIGKELARRLVVPRSRVAAIADVGQPGTKVGVSHGSTSQAALAREYRNAILVLAPSLKIAAEMLSKGEVDTIAANKAILFEMADDLRGARVLDGRWGLEHRAIAIPKGREAGMEYVRRFGRDVRDEGRVRRAAERAGLRGTLDAAAP